MIENNRFAFRLIEEINDFRAISIVNANITRKLNLNSLFIAATFLSDMTNVKFVNITAKISLFCKWIIILYQILSTIESDMSHIIKTIECCHVEKIWINNYDYIISFFSLLFENTEKCRNSNAHSSNLMGRIWYRCMQLLLLYKITFQLN